MRWFALAFVLGVAGCGGGPLSLLAGGGPNVAANVQAGRQNVQTLGRSEVFAPDVSRARAGQIAQAARDQVVTAERVEAVTILEAPAVPLWYWLGTFAAVLVAWELPRSSDMGRAIAAALAWLWRRGWRHD